MMEDNVLCRSRIVRDRRKRKQIRKRLSKLLRPSPLRVWQIDVRIVRISLIKIARFSWAVILTSSR